MLTAVVYSGLNSHYNEPKAFLLNRQRPGEQSLFPTNPGDLVDLTMKAVMEIDPFPLFQCFTLIGVPGCPLMYQKCRRMESQRHL